MTGGSQQKIQNNVRYFEQRKVMSIEFLPPELLIEILCNFTFKELIILSVVCFEWNEHIKYILKSRIKKFINSFVVSKENIMVLDDFLHVQSTSVIVHDLDLKKHKIKDNLVEYFFSYQDLLFKINYYKILSFVFSGRDKSKNKYYDSHIVKFSIYHYFKRLKCNCDKTQCFYYEGLYDRMSTSELRNIVILYVLNDYLKPQSAYYKWMPWLKFQNGFNYLKCCEKMAVHVNEFVLEIENNYFS